MMASDLNNAQFLTPTRPAKTTSMEAVYDISPKYNMSGFSLEHVVWVYTIVSLGV